MLLRAPCWMKRVSSSGAIEKPCQLMIVPGLLVIDSVLPDVTIDAWPEVTEGPVGLAQADTASAQATATASRDGRSRRRRGAEAVCRAGARFMDALRWVPRGAG